MLIILEGPDGAGKSHLAEELGTFLPGALHQHHDAAEGKSSRELSQSYMGSMRPALAGSSLLLDRSWLSEPIYARIFRKTPSRVSSVQRRMLERSALQAGGTVVLCLPPLENCLATWRSRRADEMLSDEGQLREVYHAYADGLDTWLPVAIYDYTVSSAEELLQRLRCLERPRPKVVLLGDRPSGKTTAQGLFTVPFVSFNGLGCSEWLSEQLEQAGIAESDLVWRNAYDLTGTPLAVERLPKDLPVLALGRNASRWCVEHQVPHRLLPHPQSHKRFYSKQEYTMINMLRRMLCDNG